MYDDQLVLNVRVEPRPQTLPPIFPTGRARGGSVNETSLCAVHRIASTHITLRLYALSTVF